MRVIPDIVVKAHQIITSLVLGSINTALTVPLAAGVYDPISHPVAEILASLVLAIPDIVVNCPAIRTLLSEKSLIS